jgi:lambda repressor-like predicted transcriptional regulator
MVGLKRMRIVLRVREYCEQRGISMVQLSRLSELQYDTIRGMFNNPARDVSILTLEKVARGLHVDIHELYTVINDG